MEHTYQLLQEEMQALLKGCWETEQPEQHKAERCYWLAYDYWEKVKAEVRTNGFTNDEDEIDFFRNIKPLFTCWLEYYLLLTETLLFIPEKRCEAISYWNDERKRCERFLYRNRDFIQYYEKGERGRDHYYFLRKYNHLTDVKRLYVFDAEYEFFTWRDQVVRSYFAMKYYDDFIKQQMEKLHVSN